MIYLEMAGDVGLDLLAEASRAAEAGVSVVEHGTDAARVERARHIRVAPPHTVSLVTVA